MLVLLLRVTWNVPLCFDEVSFPLSSHLGSAILDFPQPRLRRAAISKFNEATRGSISYISEELVVNSDYLSIVKLLFPSL